MKIDLTAVAFFMFLPVIALGQVDINVDGQFDDWNEIIEYKDDPDDTFGGPADSTLDILSVRFADDLDFFYVFVTVKESIFNGKTERGAYQTIIDADNNYNTGIQSDKETPYPPHEKPLGVDFYLSVETNQGVYQGIGLEQYHPDATDIDQDQSVIGAEVDAVVNENRYELKCDLDSLGIKRGDLIRISILHYSAAGTADWIMPPIDYTVGKCRSVDPSGKLTLLWSRIKCY